MPPYPEPCIRQDIHEKKLPENFQWPLDRFCAAKELGKYASAFIPETPIERKIERHFGVTAQHVPSHYSKRVIYYSRPSERRWNLAPQLEGVSPGSEKTALLCASPVVQRNDPTSARASSGGCAVLRLKIVPTPQRRAGDPVMWLRSGVDRGTSCTVYAVGTDHSNSPANGGEYGCRDGHHDFIGTEAVLHIAGVTRTMRHLRGVGNCCGRAMGRKNVETRHARGLGKNKAGFDNTRGPSPVSHWQCGGCRDGPTLITNRTACTAKSQLIRCNIEQRKRPV
ncbi:hypothetical protein EDB83DRAFT_2316570 [Lactarius deliciosus]|nr:hypothetical protein EDB83DRAFT_2316570 [Lactarius deliciosus]